MLNKLPNVYKSVDCIYHIFERFKLVQQMNAIICFLTNFIFCIRLNSVLLHHKI